MISNLIRHAFCYCRRQTPVVTDRLQETILSTVNTVFTEQGMQAGIRLARHFRANQLELGEMVGRGSTSRVYEVAGKAGRRAVKILRYSEQATSKKGEAEHLVAGIRSRYLVVPEKIFYYDGRMVAALLPFSEGEDLHEVLSHRELTLKETAQVGIDVCRGLEALHRKGVVHADINLQNIRLTKQGAVLFDYGLSRKTGSLPKGDSSRGTIQYASLQRFVGSEPFDPADDAYSLGVLLHRIFYRKFPERGTPAPKDAREAALQEVVRGLMQQKREGRMSVSEAKERLKRMILPRPSHPRGRRPLGQPS